MKKIITVVVATMLFLVTIISGQPVRAAEPGGTATNFDVSPTKIDVTNVMMTINMEYSFNADADDVVTIRIPDILVKDQNPANIRILSDIVDKASVTTTHTGTAWNGNCNQAWTDGYWEVEMKIDTGNKTGQGTISVTTETPTYPANCTQGPLPVQMLNNNVLDPANSTNVSIEQPGTRIGWGTKSITNYKFVSSSNQYAQAVKAKAASAEYKEASLNGKLGVGTISVTDDLTNRTTISLTAVALASTPTLTNVSITDTLPEGVSIYKPKAGEVAVDTTASGFSIRERKRDLADVDFGYLPEPSGPTYLTNQFTEVQGNFGDPLNAKEIRVTQDADTGQWHFEINYGDIAREDELVLTYYQHVDVDKIPNPPVYGDYPEFINYAKVNWNSDTASLMTWQTLTETDSSAYTASKSVSKSAITIGDELTYTIDIKSLRNNLDLRTRDAAIQLPVIEDSITVSNPNKCSTDYTVETNSINMTCTNLMLNDNVKLTFKVDTEHAGMGDVVKNQFFLIGSDDSILMGNKVYTDINSEVQVLHVDKNGDALATTEKLFGKLGSAFTSSAKTIPGYVLIESPTNTGGSYTKSLQTVTYVYAKIGSDVTVKYVDKKGNDLETAIVLSGNVDDAYTSEEKTFAGYTLLETPSNATGTFTDEAQTVTYVYAKNAADVTVLYTDKNGNEIESSEVLSGNVDDTYTSVEKAIEGYLLLATPSNATGTFTDEAQTVTYVYAKIAADVTVLYTDKNGNEIEVSEVLSGNEDDTYTSVEKAIEGYVLLEVPTNATGIFTGETQTVTYVYAKIAANVTVLYTDKAGNEIESSEVLSGNVDDTYTSTEKAIEGYVLLATPTNATGLFTDETQTVTYVYDQVAADTTTNNESTTNDSSLPLTGQNSFEFMLVGAGVLVISGGLFTLKKRYNRK